MSKSIWSSARPLLVVGMTLLVGCQGWLSVDGVQEHNAPSNRGADEYTSPGGDETSPDEADDSSDNPSCGGAPTPGSSSMRRLTQYEYHRTVDDLLSHVDTVPSYEFKAEEEIGSFDANVVASVGDLTTGQYRDAARDLAERSTDTDDDLVALLPCAPDNVGDACAKQFVERFGMRTFRQPLTDADASRWLEVFQKGEEQFDVQTAVRMVVTGMLQSPKFLYRRAVGRSPGPNDDVVELTDFELANRLSYLLWGTMPDDTLLEVAERGELTDPDEMRSQAERMLDDPLAREHLTHVVQQWLGVDELETLDAVDDKPELVESMRREIVAFVDHILWEREGSLETLLTADYSFVDDKVAALYGAGDQVDPPEDGLAQLEFDGTRRRGILTIPGVLAAHSYGENTIFRGEFLTNKLICTSIPDKPPQEVIEEQDPPETHEGQSMRSRAENRMDHSYCGSCHKPMEGAGLVFEPYDSMGRYRETDEQGRQLEARGHLHRADDLNGTVEGVDQLAERLAQSDRVRNCVARQFFTYVFAREPGKADACEMEAMRQAMEDNGGDLRSMIVAATATDAFRYRKVPEN